MSSTSLDYPASSLQENPRPNGQVLTPRRGGHDIPSAVRLPDHQWRHDLSLGLEVQVEKSAHPMAATRHRACPDPGSAPPIRSNRASRSGLPAPFRWVRTSLVSIPSWRAASQSIAAYTRAVGAAGTPRVGGN